MSKGLEVVWDLDTELQQAADELGVIVERTRTAGPTDAFSSMVVDLIEEGYNGLLLDVATFVEDLPNAVDARNAHGWHADDGEPKVVCDFFQTSME